METSDSECFESADEEFYSDESDDSKESISVIQNQLSSLKITQKTSEITSNNVHNTDFTEATSVLDSNQKVADKSLEKEVPAIKKTTSISQKLQPENTEKIEELVQNQKEDVKQIDTSNKVSVQEVLKDIKFKESTEIKNSSNDVGKEISTPTKSDNEPQKDNLQTENNLDENLWEADGWEIEEEIEIPSNKCEILNAKDPLSVSTENMWENQEWEDVDEPQLHQSNTDDHSNTNKTANKQNNSDSWGSWGNWGVTSLLSTATQSVSTITSQVSQGLSSVLETGIGIPTAEELAKINLEEEKKVKEIESSENTQELTDKMESDIHGNPIEYVFGNFGSLVSGVSNITKFVENTSTKVISGGLGTLETIGKKTFEVLQEGDPGLKKKRAFLKLEQEKPILSQVLREAKERAEQENLDNQSQTNQITKKINYEALFDDFHGLVHLEALEMVSKQCELRLRTLCDNCSGDALVELQETIEQIKELCELPDEDEDEQLTLDEIKEKLQLAVEDININVTYEKLITSWEETENWLDNLKTNICSEEELHYQAIETLAQLTALAVEQYHKAGELLLIKDHHSTADEADSLVQLTTTLTSLIGIIAAKFSEKLNLMLSSRGGEHSKENINNLITNVFFEASNSSSYIQDAFQLLIPVLQVGAV